MLSAALPFFLASFSSTLSSLAASRELRFGFLELILRGRAPLAPVASRRVCVGGPLWWPPLSTPGINCDLAPPALCGYAAGTRKPLDFLPCGGCDPGGGTLTRLFGDQPAMR